MTNKKYSRLNQLTKNYVQAMNSDANPEELHCYLKDLLSEAIKEQITLEHLLRVLSGSSIEEANTEKFIENVSRHYAYGISILKNTKNKES